MARPSDEVVDRLVRLSREAPPRCGRTVVIGIDGPSGSGKTTLASAVQARVGGAVVHMDDLFHGWDGLAQAVGLLTDQVLRPLATGVDGAYRRWDWLASAWAETIAVPSAPVLIVEGCASTVVPAAHFVAVRVWVEADPQVRMSRGLERDGEAFRPHWQRWAEQERALFEADGTRQRADLIVRT